MKKALWLIVIVALSSLALFSCASSGSSGGGGKTHSDDDSSPADDDDDDSSFGACCTQNHCSVKPYSSCPNDWQGPGTTCNPNPCIADDDDNDNDNDNDDASPDDDDDNDDSTPDDDDNDDASPDDDDDNDDSTPDDDDDNDDDACTVLLSQVPSGNPLTGIPSDQFAGNYAESRYLADDFDVPTGHTWRLDRYYVEGFQNALHPEDSQGLHVAVYADAGGQPDGFPGGPAFLWGEDYEVTDPNVTYDGGGGATIWAHSPHEFTAGKYWFVFYVDTVYEFPPPMYWWCWGVSPITNNGAEAMLINPGGGMGYGTVWITITSTDPGDPINDLAMVLWQCGSE